MRIAITPSLKASIRPVDMGRELVTRPPTSLEAVRIVRFASPQGMSFGVLDGDGQVAQIEGHPFGQISFTGARYAQADVRLLSPILPSKVVASARTTPTHVEGDGHR